MICCMEDDTKSIKLHTTLFNACKTHSHFLLACGVQAVIKWSANWGIAHWILWVTICEGSWRLGWLSTIIYEHGKQLSSSWATRLLVIRLPICYMYQLNEVPCLAIINKIHVPWSIISYTYNLTEYIAPRWNPTLAILISSRGHD